MTKYFAVFGDTHGHLRLMFRLCQLWQQNNACFLDGILQCGDLGFFPKQNNLDRATKRFAQRDPEELGFKYFMKPEPMPIDPKLDQIHHSSESGFETVKAPVFFCHGNHEDFDSLRDEVGNANIKAVDYYKRIHWLRPGYVHLTNGINIATVGGGVELSENILEKEGLQDRWAYIDKDSCKKLQKMKFDVLLSHVSPSGIGGASDNFGSEQLRNLVKAVSPSYHFYAHHTNRIEPATIGNTKCYWLNDVNFCRKGKTLKMPLEKGCMGILSWENEHNHSFEIVENKWFDKVDFLNWWK